MGMFNKCFRFKAIALLSVMTIICCTGCSTSSNPSKSATPVPTVSAISLTAIEEIDDRVKNIINDYDASVYVKDNNGIEISLYLRGGLSISEYTFAHITKHSLDVVKDVVSKYSMPINKIQFYGIGETRVLQWETADLIQGTFMDLPKPTTHRPSTVKVMTINEVMKFCGYSE